MIEGGDTLRSLSEERLAQIVDDERRWDAFPAQQRCAGKLAALGLKPLGEIVITGMWDPGPAPVPPGHARVTIGDEEWIVPEKIARRLWLRSLRRGHRRYVRRHDPRARRR